MFVTAFGFNAGKTISQTIELRQLCFIFQIQNFTVAPGDLRSGWFPSSIPTIPLRPARRKAVALRLAATHTAAIATGVRQLGVDGNAQTAALQGIRISGGFQRGSGGGTAAEPRRDRGGRKNWRVEAEPSALNYPEPLLKEGLHPSFYLT